MDTLKEIISTFERWYEDACKKDPGLPEAWERAKRRNPNIGWLDVAVEREKKLA